MSLFQLKDWWHCKVGEGEEFDVGSLVVGNIDNASPASDKIAVGSLEGCLRIYHPNQASFHAMDLIYEDDLKEPILQLLLGRFVPASPSSVAIAVLHPRRLTVYELFSKDNGSTKMFKLERVFHHILGMDGKHFSACNMTCGPFGFGDRAEDGSSAGTGKGPCGDLLMVQSMDGKLQIFEQTAEAFTVQMVDNLIPGPLVYLPRTDAFVTGSYACRAECYKYQVLASAQTQIGVASASLMPSESTTAIGLSAVRAAMVDWSHNLGEPIRQIVPGRFSKKASKGKEGRGGEVMVLCERSLFLVKEGGGIVQQKRLDRGAQPLCCHAFTSANNQSVLALAYDDGLIQIYHDFVVAWAAKLDSSSPPADLCVGCFGGQPGLLVVLHQDGNLSVCYLGTAVPRSTMVTAPPDHDGEDGGMRELDYDAMEAEHRSLLRSIREAQVETRSHPREKLLVRTQLGHAYDPGAAAGDRGSNRVRMGVPSAVLRGDGSGVDVPNMHDGSEAGAESKGVAGGMQLLMSNEQKKGLLKTSAKLYVSYTGSTPIENVTIVVDAPTGVTATPPQLVLSTLGGGGRASNHVSHNSLAAGGQSNSTTPLLLPFTFFATTALPSPVLDATFAATYYSDGGDPRSVVHTTQLPMLLACRLKAPTKSAPYKLVLATPDSPIISLTNLFDEFLLANQDSGVDVNTTLGSSASMALGFAFWAPCCDIMARDDVDELAGAAGRGLFKDPDAAPTAGATGSVLASKQAGRYRIQADCPWALAFLVYQVEKRLRDSFAVGPPMAGTGTRTGVSSMRIEYSDDLPLDDFCEAFEGHFYIRLAAKELSSQLNDRAHQFRIIQKRLLQRYKSKNPTALNNMDVLLKETYDDIMNITERLQRLHDAQRAALQQVDARARLLSLLVCIKFPHLTQEDRTILEAHLCPLGVEGFCEDSHGWEETVDASLTYLLKTSLAKNAKDAATLPTCLEMPLSCDKLRKHLVIVIDRLSKGARLAPSEGPANGRGGGKESKYCEEIREAKDSGKE